MVASLAGLGTIGSMGYSVVNGQSFGGVDSFISGMAEIGEEQYNEDGENGTTMGACGNLAASGATVAFAKGLQNEEYLLKNVFDKSSKARNLFKFGKKALLPVAAWRAYQGYSEVSVGDGDPLKDKCDFVGNVVEVGMLAAAAGGKKGLLKSSKGLLSKIKQVWANA